MLNLDARIQHWMKQGSLSEAHGKILASLPLDKQYWFAYEAIKKEWSVRMLDDAIKSTDSENTRKNQKQTVTTQLERQLVVKLGYTI